LEGDRALSADYADYTDGDETKQKPDGAETHKIHLEACVWSVVLFFLPSV